MQDIWCFGQYFWDVIGGIRIWVPMLVLERGMAANRTGR
jgi:hypothetical protein